MVPLESEIRLLGEIRGKARFPEIVSSLKRAVFPGGNAPWAPAIEKKIRHRQVNTLKAFTRRGAESVPIKRGVSLLSSP